MSPLTLHFTGRLWTADGVLKNGLRAAEFDRLVGSEGDFRIEAASLLRHFLRLRLRQELREHRADQRIATGHARAHERHARRIGFVGGGERQREPRSRRAQHAAADVRRETLARAAQVNCRPMVAPATGLRKLPRARPRCCQWRR